MELLMMTFSAHQSLAWLLLVLVSISHVRDWCGFGVMIGGARARQERRNAEAAQDRACGRALSTCMQGRGYATG